MDEKRLFLCLILSTALLSTVVDAESWARIEGYVTDKDTGRPYTNISVYIYSPSDHSNLIASDETDGRGFYNITVQPGKNYDIYVRVGKTNPSESVYVRYGEICHRDFKLSMQSVNEGEFLDEPEAQIVFLVAAIILILILVDQIFMKRRRRIRELERERRLLEKEIETKEKQDVDELTQLEKERNTINYSINLAKIKYHKRSLNERSFRDIIRDYEKRLIEIESRIREIKRDREVT